MALGIVASYCQEIFDAVPLFLLNGPANSGKTELADEAAKLACNGKSLGRTTLAAFMEATDRCRGLIALDDVEEVAAGTSIRKKVSTNQWQQIIKQSYKKVSGTQTRMGDRGELKTRNLYGIKILNNTKGIDEITASRMFVIHTLERTEAQMLEMVELSEDIQSPDQIRMLRNKLHQWVFWNVQNIASTYRAIMAKKVERSDEIAAPLRALAELSKDASLIEQVESANSRRKGKQTVDEKQALEKAIQAIVAQGHKHLCAQHVINEMKHSLGPAWAKANDGHISEWQQPKFITGQLLSGGWVIPKACRPRISHNLEIRIRAYPVREDRLKQVRDNLEKDGRSIVDQELAPGSFCSGCSKCIYSSFCSLKKHTNEELSSR